LRRAGRPSSPRTRSADQSYAASRSMGLLSG
jgi:hypothetical protein